MAKKRKKTKKSKSDPNIISQRGIANSGVNIGGIGTGGVELWPDGRLYFWNIINSRPWSKAFKEHAKDRKKGSYSVDPVVPKIMDTDFIIRIQEKGKRPLYRWLFTGNAYTADTGSHFFRHHKYSFIKSYRSIEYSAEYPFIYLEYKDPEMPVDLTLRAWTSFIPRDVKNSSIPGGYFDFKVTNRGKKPVDVSLIWQMQNLAGSGLEGNTQDHVKRKAGGASIVQMKGGLNRPDFDTSGDMSIWAIPAKKQKATSISANPYMQNIIWSIHRSGNLEDGPLVPERLAREELNPQPPEKAPNKGWLCVQDRAGAGKTCEFNFGLSWFFPNHRSIRGTRVGHMYENWFKDSVSVASYMARNREKLLDASLLLPNELMISDLPEKLKLSLLDQLNTLTKSTHFIRNGRIGLQEGHGCCAFNTVDVDHYSSYAFATLFPSLRKKILQMQTALAHPKNGKIHHGLPGTVEEIKAGGGAGDGYSRWDCSCQYILQVYRDTKWAGDRAEMKACWPTVKKAIKLVSQLDFYKVGLPYIVGGITYDHWHMKGVVGYMAGVYLAALRATEDMASLVRDREMETWAREVFEQGRESFEKLLYNGNQYLLYYARRPKGWKPGDDPRGEPKLFDPVPPPEECMDTEDCGADCACHREPAYVEIQDAGMMTDLLNGNATAGVMGLGTFLTRARVKRQLNMILERNTQEENNCVLNGSYPDGHFLDEWPFMQWQTPWSGTEYFLALQLYVAGMNKEGDKVVDMVFDRHVREGMRFDHSECNNHYARPLCLWGAYTARLGLDVDGFRNILSILPEGSNSYTGALITAQCLGRLFYRAGKNETNMGLGIIDGSLSVKKLVLKTKSIGSSAVVTLNGKKVEFTSLKGGNGRVELVLKRKISLGEGDIFEADIIME